MEVTTFRQAADITAAYRGLHDARYVRRWCIGAALTYRPDPDRSKWMIPFRVPGRGDGKDRDPDFVVELPLDLVRPFLDDRVNEFENKLKGMGLDVPKEAIR